MSVGKEKNGTYTVQCWYREQLTGERHKKTKRGFKRKSDAVRWERDFLMKAAGSPTMKFADYCEVYKSDMLPRLKLNTWRTKEYIIRDKILPYFGGKALSDISPADVLEWQTRLIARIDPKTGKPYKKTYLRTVNNILSAMLNHAVRFYGLPSNPMKRIGKIGSGLMEQLGEFADGHDDLKMVIIDTFQTVRTPSSQTVYSADYEDMGALKAFADERWIALLVIHHTRKMGDGDVFNTISGSNGLMGCADETMVLRRKARGSSAATLNITGRDVKDQEFSVRFVDCRWELVEKVSDEELEARAVPAVVHSVIAFVNGRQAPSWCGTAPDLLAAVGGDVRANILSKYLNEHSGYMESQGVVYSRRKTGGEKLICLEGRTMKVARDDG